MDKPQLSSVSGTICTLFGASGSSTIAKMGTGGWGGGGGGLIVGYDCGPCLGTNYSSLYIPIPQTN